MTESSQKLDQSLYKKLLNCAPPKFWDNIDDYKVYSKFSIRGKKNPLPTTLINMRGRSYIIYWKEKASENPRNSVSSIKEL